MTGFLSAAAQRSIINFERRVAEVLSRLPVHRGKRLLVGVSGGPDSVAILHALHRLRARLNFELAAAHFNHAIRALESDRDEQFVRELCDRLQIELLAERGPALKPANLEEQARELRYDFLNRAADRLDAQFIVLGHHQDDQAETVLLRLLRGSGVAGLGAMAESGPGRMLRPLLTVDRAEIIRYLKTIGADYVTDSSNFEHRALRNRVRSHLLPTVARDYSPGIARHLAQLASEIRHLNSYIEGTVCQVLDGVLIQPSEMSRRLAWRIKLDKFESMPAAMMSVIMRELIRRCVGTLRGIERTHIDAMCRLVANKRPSCMLMLPRRWRFRREYDTVILESQEGPDTDITSVPVGREVTLVPGENSLTFGGSTLTVRHILAGDSNFPVAPWHPLTRFEAYFDGARVSGLKARCFHAGDRIRPLGLCGSRKVHDVFVDNKVKIADRRSWPLVLSGDEVIWVPGLVRSAAALLTAESKKVLHLRADSLPGELKVRLLEL
jgi:tRNA(Ile)-lysidine synthase